MYTIYMYIEHDKGEMCSVLAGDRQRDLHRHRGFYFDTDPVCPIVPTDPVCPIDPTDPVSVSTANEDDPQKDDHRKQEEVNFD